MDKAKLAEIKPYKPWDFCKSVNCYQLEKIKHDERCKQHCQNNCYAYKMHQYLKGNNQIYEEGSALACDYAALQEKVERLERIEKTAQDIYEIISLGHCDFRNGVSAFGVDEGEEMSRPYIKALAKALAEGGGE